MRYLKSKGLNMTYNEAYQQIQYMRDYIATVDKIYFNPSSALHKDRLLRETVIKTKREIARLEELIMLNELESDSFKGVF